MQFKTVATGVALFFFFQAEDGIRDDLVTGVQTCALPIYSPDATSMSARDATSVTRRWFVRCAMKSNATVITRSPPRACTTIPSSGGPSEIGRASCRERV